MELVIKDMTCGGCAKAVTRLVTRLDPEATVEIDLPTQKVSITSRHPAAKVRETLSRGGFPPA